MDAEKLEKVMKGLEACSVGVACGPGCPYEYLLDIQGQAGCIATMARDALEIIKEQEARKAEARAMLNALGQAAENMPVRKRRLANYQILQNSLLESKNTCLQMRRSFPPGLVSFL